jgi:retron-type reverse transcriptase
VPLRPIVSNIGAPTYKLSKYLANLLKPFVGQSTHHVKNSAAFINIVDSLKLETEDLMVSFDVVSLFTKVPISDSISLLKTLFSEDIVNLFEHVLTSTYFIFHGQFFEQTDGVAMGSPLSPVIANFFMEAFEQKVMKMATYKQKCWYRYVDDTFVIWPRIN